MQSAAIQLDSPEMSVRPNDLFSSPVKRNLVVSLALILLTVAAYYPIRNNGFINFDDKSYITDNPHVKAGLSWETVKWAFTTFDAANWHPTTWLSHALDCQLFGVNPVAHHLISVLLHAVNAVLLFLILQSFTGLSWRSLMVAALFAVHPLNVESVAWAAERKTILSATFFLLALAAYCRYVRKPSVAPYLGVAGLFALALMCKPQVIILPFALLLLDYWPLKRIRLLDASATTDSRSAVRQESFGRLLIEKIPLFGLSSISAMITLQAQHAGHAVRTAIEYSLGSRVETAIASYVLYVRDTLLPWHLAPIYPHADGLLETWKVLLAGAVLVALSALAVLARKSAPYVLFGWLWFLVSLAPMIGLIQVGEQARADRYMYISMIGILVAVVWGIADCSSQYKVSPAWNASACVAVLSLFSIATYRQVGYWHDSETLWNYTLRVTDRNFMAEDNLAQELATQGRTKEALIHFHNILNVHDWPPSELIGFGMYEQRQGYAADAIVQYRRAFRKTSDAKTRSVELSNIGSAYLDLKDREHARQSFDQALQADPDNGPAIMGSGLIAQKNGDLKLAVSQYAKAVSIKPSDLGYALLARALEQSGRTSDANAAYAQAQKLSPNVENLRSTVDHLLAE